MSAQVSPSTPSLNTGEKTASNSTNTEKPFHEYCYHKPKQIALGLQDLNSRFLTEDMVNVFVGLKRKKFHLHKALLCHHSSFFQKALDGAFKEHEDKAVYLPDDNAEAFVLFVQWMYNAPPQKSPTLAALAALIALYVMADKFCIEELKNLSMDVVRASYGEALVISMKHIEQIYVNASGSSPMRRFITNYISYVLFTGKGKMSKKFLRQMQKGGDFAADFVLATLQYLPGAARPDDPSKERKCAYHEHHFTKPCP